MIGQGRDELGQLVGRRGHVRVGKDDQVRIGGQHPGPDGRALAAVGHLEQVEAQAGRRAD